MHSRLCIQGIFGRVVGPKLADKGVLCLSGTGLPYYVHHTQPLCELQNAVPGPLGRLYSL